MTTASRGPLPGVFTRPAAPPDRVLRYGRHPDQVIDIRRITRRPDAAVVVLLHGGFWQARYDRLHMRPMADELARRGYVVCVPEYRRLGQPGGGYPGTFDDVAAAVDAVLDDPPAAGPVVLVGHSAGGHLALWTTMRHRLPVTSRWHTRPGSGPGVHGCVGLAPVADLGGAIEAGVGAGACRDLLGGRLGLLAETDPARLLPYGPGPLALVHGSADRLVPIEISRGFAARERSARLVELSGVGHFGLIDPLSPAWPAVLAVIDSIAGPV
ncbi:alpha/beta hydrolase [Sphaerimonospora cavernae]|uniref:Alpha/beta hydrolase n=1 Tax=Sphaerimonospora cavernae TaxID=1740611 RepID=A0ABV6UC07_9ACTN